MSTTEAPPASPNCWHCRHFGLTYQPQMPYVCRQMGFKSQKLPAWDVLLIDGKPCRGFASKPAASVKKGS